MQISEKYNAAFGRIFSPQVLNPIAEDGNSSYLNEIFQNSGLLGQIDTSMQFSTFLDLMYSYLFKNYQFEYIYKNTLVNKLLLGRHSLNTAHMLTEFRVGNRKADAVLLNGSTSVYEIKTAYDSYARLLDQVYEYNKMFEYINVFTSKSQIHSVQKLVPNNVGILFLSKDNISVHREASSNKANINLSVVFDSLRKNEFMSIVKAYYQFIPDVPNTKLFSECKRLFCKIPLNTANELFVNVLKQRKNAKILNKFLKDAPTSLSAYAISSIGSEERLNTLLHQLNRPVESLLH